MSNTETEFEQIIGRKPSIEAMLRETTEQVFALLRETRDPKDWTYPMIGTMIYKSIPEDLWSNVVGHLLDVYINEAYWAMRRRECQPMAVDREAR